MPLSTGETTQSKGIASSEGTLDLDLVECTVVALVKHKTMSPSNERDSDGSFEWILTTVI